MKKFLTIDDFDFRGKRVLLRVDLNSEVVNGKVILSDRFTEHAKTIKELKRKKAKVVVLAHQSRPGKKEFISLKQHSKLLNKFVKVKFVDDIIGEKAINKIKNLKNGEALLLENVRFLREEFRGDSKNRFVKKLKSLFDIFVSDAFSVAHRKQTSTFSFAKVLPSCIGRVMEKELNALQNISNKKPRVYILAGAKPEENVSLLKNLLKKRKVEKVLTAGLFGQLCLIAKGYDFGGQNKFFKKIGLFGFVSQLRNVVKDKRIETPLDLAVKVKGKRKEIKVENFPVKEEIFDIGSETIKKYVGIIKKAKTIFVKGTLGYCEDKKFRKGTKMLYKAIEKSKAFSLMGGGHTLTAIKDLNIRRDRISHISLSGGALLEYLAGKKLPGLEVLKRGKNV